MLQKLKNTSILCAAMVLIGGLVFGLSSGVASASTSHTEFVCNDGSTDITTKIDKSTQQATVTCKSGATIIYINYDDTGNQPIGVDVTCPGTQVAGTGVDTPNAPTSKYIFYCVSITGSGDNAKSTKTKGKITVKSVPAVDVKCPDGTTPKNNDTTNCSVAAVTDPAATSGNCSDISKCDFISDYLNPFIDFLAALVGVGVVISIIIGGVQYGSSAGDPQKVTAAKDRIRNSIIALVTFLFLYALLNFLIPGGLF